MSKRIPATAGYAGLHADGLTLAQLNAVDALAAGKNDTETAAVVGVHRVTVTKWRRYSPDFQAALNRKRADIWAGGIDRLRSLLPKALDALGDLLANGPPDVRLKAAVAVANLCPLAPETFAVGPADPEDVLEEEVMRRRESQRATLSEVRRSGYDGHPLELSRHRELVRGELGRAMNIKDPPPDPPPAIPENSAATDVVRPH